MPVKKTESADKAAETKTEDKPFMVEKKAAPPKPPLFDGAVPPGKGGVYRIVNGKRVKINR